MSLSVGQAIRELEEGKGRAVYWVAGDEYFQIDELLARLRQHFAKAPETYDAEETELSAWREALDSQPLFAEPGARWIVCRRWEKASSPFADSLAIFVDNPLPDTVVVLVSGKPDKRKQAFKVLAERVGFIEVAEPPDREWGRWRSFFEKRTQKQIEELAWSRLVESSHSRLAVVASELAKLTLFVGAASVIRAEDVELFGSVAAGVSVFSFTDCVVTFQRAEAVRQYEWLLRSGEPEIKLAALVLRALRQVKTASEFSGRPLSNTEMASQLGVPPFVASKIVAQAARHTERTVRAAMDWITQCDQRLKQGRGNFFADFLVPYFSLTPPPSVKKLSR